MLRNRIDVIKRCRAMRQRERLEQQHAARLSVARESTASLSQARRRASSRASAESNYRSMSVDDEEAETELAEENEAIFRSATNDESSGPLPASVAVTDEDRAMRDTIRMLAIPPVDDAQAQRHMNVVKELEGTVDEQRAKASGSTILAIDRMFKAGKNYAEHLPIAHIMAASYNFFARAFIQKHAAEERALLAGACQEFVDKENALRVASEAAEAADANARCTTTQCVICFSDQPAGNIFALNSGWTTLTCRHGFCTDCLEQWTKTGSHTCPLCRAPIFTAYGNGQPPNVGAQSSFPGGVSSADEPVYRPALSADGDDDDDDDGGVFYRDLSNDTDDDVVYRSVQFRSTSTTA
jgi:hypothetical protein